MERYMSEGRNGMHEAHPTSPGTLAMIFAQFGVIGDDGRYMTGCIMMHPTCMVALILPLILL